MSEWFKRFKLSLHNRIKKGTVEVDVKGQRVLMKYGGFFFKEYHIINPPVIEVDGKLKMIWPNFIFGGWKNLFKLLGTITIFALVFWSVDNLFNQYNAIISDTCVKTCLSNVPTLDMKQLPKLG